MSTLDSFRTARWVRTLNLVLQAGLFLALFFQLNYLALHHPSRFDLTQHRQFSLSPETLSWLHNLDEPVRIVVTIQEDSGKPEVEGALLDIRGLLREYVYATAPNFDPKTNHDGRVSVDYLDVYQRRREADELGIDQPNTVTLICGDKHHTVLLGELYQVGTDREGKPQWSAFKGEQVITAALLEVSSPTRKKIYFLTGHGEMRPDDSDPARGLSELRNQLRLRNFDLGLLDVRTEQRVPEDAALIIVADPQGIEPIVQERLREYLTAKAGRLILLVRPGAVIGLDRLVLDDWGILVDDDLICDSDPNFMTEGGDLVVKAFVAHPITQTLLSYQLALLIGPARSVRALPGSPDGTGLTVTTLAATSQSAWGERSYNTGRPPEYNPGVDYKGSSLTDKRLGVVIASERVGARDKLDFSVPRGRLVVFGTADLVTNNRLGNTGNQNIFFAAVNWAVDRDTQLNIPARPIERFQLSLSAADLLKLRYSLLLVLPAAAAVLGLMVYWTRRR
jgi:ABC-type uncharacterized transport system